MTGSVVVVPVPLVTGPVGVGKSAVLHEADRLLVRAGRRHVSIELGEIARFWRGAADEQPGEPLVWRSLVSRSSGAAW